MDVVDPPELSAAFRTALELPTQPGHLSALVVRHGTMELRIFRPVPEDRQSPHDRDELYIVAAGSAVLLRGAHHSPWEEPELMSAAAERIAMGAGDAVVVPAGTPHCFEEASPDFATWMVFWGPEGGEAP